MCHVMGTMARLKKLLSVYIDPDVKAQLEEWLAKQPFPTTKTAAVETALRDFLKTYGDGAPTQRTRHLTPEEQRATQRALRRSAKGK